MNCYCFHGSLRIGPYCVISHHSLLFKVEHNQISLTKYFDKISGHRQDNEGGTMYSTHPSGTKRKDDIRERDKNKKHGAKPMIQTTLRTVKLTKTATDNTPASNANKSCADAGNLSSATKDFTDDTGKTDWPGRSNNSSQKRSKRVLNESQKSENAIRIGVLKRAKCLSEIEGSGFIVKHDGDATKGGTITCTICHHYVHDSKFCKVKRDRGFVWGIDYPRNEFAKFIEGGNKSWYSLKHRMTQHLDCSADVGGGTQHLKALLYRQRNEVVSKSMLERARNLILSALTAIKHENPALDYKSMLGSIYACNAPVGDSDHARQQFNEIVKTLCVYARIKTKELLSRKLPSTGMPPHFSTASGKCTPAANSNHAVMILTMYEGRKMSIPVTACALHNATDDDNSTGETECNLAKQVIDSLTLYLNLESETLCRLVSHQADWQYDVTSGFRQTLISAAHSDCVPADCEKYLVVACDAAQWMDQCFTGVNENRDTMLCKFRSRCRQFLELFVCAGLKYAVCEGHDHDKPELPLNIRTFLNITFTTSSRYATSTFAIFQYIYSNYPALNATLVESRIYGYECDMFRGRDFAMDLCGVLDCLTPMMNVIIKLQSIDNHFWDIVRMRPRLKQIMLAQIDELRHFDRSDGPDSELFPRLNLHWLDLSDADDSIWKFHGQSLVKGLSRTATKGEGTMRVTSAERYPEECLDGIRVLTENLVNDIDARFEKCTPIAARELANCFDAHQAVISASDSENWATNGLAEFTNFFAYVCSLKQVREAACEVRGLHLYPHFSEQAWVLSRNAIRLVLFQDFANCRQKWFQCDSAECVIPNGVALEGFEVSRRKTEIENEYKLKFGEEVYTCRLNEREFYKTFYRNEEFFAAVGKEFCIALDVALNMGSSGDVFDSFNSVMESQKLNTGQDEETLAQRAIVDWLFPAMPTEYLNTVDEIAKLYRDGDRRYGLSKHRDILDVRGEKQRSIEVEGEVINCLPQSQRSQAFILLDGDR